MKSEILPKLDLNVTNRCNFRCVHCAFNSGLCKMPEMKIENLERILLETKKIGGQRFDITGGEATLREDLNEIIRIGKSIGYKIELVTNGSLLTKEKLTELKKVGLDAIAISLDGSNYKNYSRIRKVGIETYNKVLNNIRDSVKLGISTKINTVVFDFNLEDITNITDWCIDHGISEHGLYYFTPIGRGDSSEERAVEPIKWLDFVRKELSRYSKEEIKITIELPLVEREYWSPKLGCIGCGQRRGHLQVLPDGNVYPCAILASYKKPITNLYEVSVENLWDDEKLWKNYWKDISQRWKNQGGFCVDFKGVFKGRDYDTQKYGFVCPLRKFKLQEIPCLENL